ncbi:unnamed protein product [Protopolystoma xenopodis]|uniref:Uncharacterized protein n=1 Tax=Protopolystoma xenopodis TaxID=117903 RepID=A0A3S5AZ97_9PLAT|nr:unnamed protein product [Protopolystoma xenopodis]
MQNRGGQDHVGGGSHRKCHFLRPSSRRLRSGEIHLCWIMETVLTVSQFLTSLHNQRHQMGPNFGFSFLVERCQVRVQK